MADTTFDVPADQKLGAKAYRLFFARESYVTDDNWISEGTRVFSSFGTAVRIAKPVTASAPAGGLTRSSSTFALDVKAVSADGQKNTVGDLAVLVQGLCDRFGRDSLYLQSIEEVGSLATSPAKDAAAKDKESRPTDTFGTILDTIRSLGSAVYWFAVLAMVLGGLFVIWKFQRAAKEATS